MASIRKNSDILSNHRFGRLGSMSILLVWISMGWLSAECAAQTCRIAANGNDMLPIVVAENSSDRSQLDAEKIWTTGRLLNFLLRE